MATAQTILTSVEDRIAETVRQGQDAILSAVRTWAEASKQFSPDLSTLSLNTDDLPRPSDLVENAFAFTYRLLDSQRDFAKSLLEAVEPVIASVSKVAPVGPTASVTAAKKTA
ncbi:MAG: hypothetical protein ACRDV9_10050 [Acidimicrobiia bacterium]